MARCDICHKHDEKAMCCPQCDTVACSLHAVQYKEHDCIAVLAKKIKMYSAILVRLMEIK